MIHKSMIAAALLGLSLTGVAYAAGNTVETGEAGVYAMTTVSAADAVAAVESSSGGKVVELVLADQNGAPVYQVTAAKADGSELSFIVDGVSGKVSASEDMQDNGDGSQSDAAESGEGANDADSGSEDAN